jgi:hypothetical protein
MCTFSASVQPVGVAFNGSIPTKVFITQNDINYSDFHPVTAILGFELRLTSYSVILKPKE